MTTQTNGRSLRPFLILWSGQAVSLLGSQLVQFALIWWLTQQTGSATVLATASLVGLLPQVILGPFVGVLVDRWNRRLTLLAADSFVALATLALAYLFWSGNIAVWHVYLLLFARALGGAFHWPAMTASTSLMVPQEHLTRIQGLNQILQGGMNIAAAPLGALLLALLPMQGILAIDVVTALFAITPLFFIFIPQPVKQTSGEVSAAVASFWDELREGLRYVRGWTGLLILMGMAMLINFMLTPASSLMPLLVTDHFQGTAWHLSGLEAAFGLGIIAGGVLLGVWGGFRRRIVTSLVALLGLGLGVLLVGAAPAELFFLAVAGMLGMGIMSSMTNGPILALFQALVAPEMQGRVLTLLTSLSMAMSPLSLIVAGPIADAIGVRTWYLVGGFVTLLVGVAGFFIPPLINIEERRDRPAAVAPAAPLAPTGLTAAADVDGVGETAV